jgi:hypothetical protein
MPRTVNPLWSNTIASGTKYASSTVTVEKLRWLTQARLAAVLLGFPYVHQELRAEINNGGSITYTLNSGVLPTGISLNSNGTLYGEPTEAGTFVFEIAARGPANTAGHP